MLFKAEIYPAGFSLKFYQEVNIENKNGGYYDFEKFEMMPYLIKCQYLLIRKSICELIEKNGFENDADSEFKYAIDKVMHKIKKCNHYKEGKELPEYEIPDYNARDKNERKLKNGETKYFRDRKGRLKRGVIYHNINNMWWVVLNKFEYTNIASFDFFDIEEEEKPLKRRLQRKTMPNRIKGDKLREKFKSMGLSYEVINEEKIRVLREILEKEFKVFGSDMELRLSDQRKKDIKVLKRTGLKYSEIQVNGYYFSRREAITFNEDGFIGFAGWACDYNLTPFVNAFDKWMDWLIEETEKVA